MKRSAAASFALAAAGMLYSRLGGRRRQPEPAGDMEASPEQHEGSAEEFEGSAEQHEGSAESREEQAASSAEVEHARSELADELRRRASRPPADE